MLLKVLKVSSWRWVAYVIAVCVVMLLSTAFAQAQSEAGISISPALIEEAINPGTSKTYVVTVKNLNTVEEVFYISTRDIVDVTESGAPVFSTENLEKTGMELANWITLDTTEITLPPGSSQEVPFILSVPADAAPGSHFGSIFISADPPEIESSGAAIGYKVANIISMRVAGDAAESANIRQFSTNSFFYTKKDVQFKTRIENTGNVLVRPIGPVTITNMLGQKVDTIMFNESQGAVFPGKWREYEFDWVGEGTGFGRYEVVLSAVYGSDGAKQTMSSTVSFWILPLNIIGPALGILALVLLITFVFVKLYIRRTLASLSYGQSRVVRRKKGRGVSATLLLVVVMLTVTALFMIVLLALFA